jgi:hypothetical protein
MSIQACARVVFPDGFDERAAFEAPSKGWLSAHVETNDGSCFSVYFSDPVRLQQDLEQNVRLGKPFLAEPGMIILPEVTVEAVHEVVHALCEQGFFTHLQPERCAS